MSCLSVRFDEFLAVAEERSFSRAADKLFLSQSTLSRHISEIEDHFGTPLFERTSPLSLTAAGRAVFYRFNEIVQTLDALDQEVELVKLSETKTVLVQNWTGNDGFRTLVMEAQDLFLRESSAVIKYVSLPADKTVTEAIGESLLDIGVLLVINEGDQEPSCDGFRFDRIDSLSGELSFFVDNSNSLVERDSVRLSELQEVPIVVPLDQEYQPDRIREYFKRHGCSPTLCYVVVGDAKDYFLHSREDCCLMFQQGVENSFTQSFLDQHKALTVEDHPAQLEVWMTASTNASSAVQDVYESILAADRRRCIGLE